MDHVNFGGIASPMPVGTYCCYNGIGLFNAACEIRTAKCGPPPNGSKEVCLSCNEGKTPQAAQPIDLATGNTYVSETDISVPGLGGGLTLTRTWNSLLPAIQNTYAFMFGPGWRSTYEERLIYNSSDAYLKYARADGSVWSFSVSSGSAAAPYQAVAPANDATTITSGASVWTLLSPNKEKRTFDATTGALLSIVDRNGNTTQLTYDSSGRLITVTDPASRHLNFAYTSPSSNLVSTVTSDVGISLSYVYDAQGRLTQVTKPDNTTVSFVYNTQNLITAVKDSDGKILESHTYDVAGRGVTSSRANGVDAVTVSYPQ